MAHASLKWRSGSVSGLVFAPPGFARQGAGGVEALASEVIDATGACNVPNVKDGEGCIDFRADIPVFLIWLGSWDPQRKERGFLGPRSPAWIVLAVAKKQHCAAHSAVVIRFCREVSLRRAVIVRFS